MANNPVQTVEEKLLNLYQLQYVTTQLDEIIKLQGELPMEVRDMEDDIEGMEKRKAKYLNQLADQEDEIQNYNNNIVESNKLMEKYKVQLDNVKNNREYEALTKEIDYQSLEVKLSEKKIRETEEKNVKVKEMLEGIDDIIADKKNHLEKKKEELEDIIQKTEKKVESLNRKIGRTSKLVDERLLKAFDALRSRYSNGLAIVTVNRNACGGCYNAVPPQLQIEISQKKDIIACENCGRVLIADDLATQVDKKERVSDIEEFPRRKIKRTLEFD
ncbi:MAG: C4-type zinc ribbon domain-containing protein [Saprospiraceae bacterium]